jgi:hypothetical protein
MRYHFLSLLIICLSLAATGCEKKPAATPQDLGLNVTTTRAISQDMPVVESDARRRRCFDGAPAVSGERGAQTENRASRGLKQFR